MANPFMIASAVAGIAKDVVGGIQANQAGKANAKNDLINAGIASDQAAREEGAVRRERDQLAGAQIAATGASGVTLDGSATTSIIDSAVTEELKALNERYKGAVVATGYRNKASAEKLAGKQAMYSGILSAVGGTVFRGLGAATVAGGGVGGGGTSFSGAMRGGFGPAGGSSVGGSVFG